QAEDGIRVFHVTGVQTCALPICTKVRHGFMLGKDSKIFTWNRLEKPWNFAKNRSHRRGTRSPQGRKAERNPSPAGTTTRGTEKRSEERRVGKEGRDGRSLVRDIE